MNIKQSLLVALLFAATAPMVAQPSLPPPFPRTNATSLLDNDRVAVWDIVWPKGQPTALHRHVNDQVGTYYARGGRTITTPDGQARTAMTEAGSLSTTRKGTTHVEEGSSDPPLRAVFIELKKDAPSGETPATSEAAPFFPRTSAKQVLDDDRVTAWDYSWSAGAAPLKYQAARETFVVFLSAGSLQITGDSGAPTTLDVQAGTMRHLAKGARETEHLTAGTPRAIIFELK
jgi:hypothetical protein